MLKDTCLIILSYKRLQNLSILTSKFKNRLPIIVINNDSDICLIPESGITTINNSENRFCIERWRVAKDLPYKYAIMLDDDVEPTNHCIMRLRIEIEKTPDRLVSMYCRSGIRTASDYDSLSKSYCKESNSEDVAIGGCLAVSIPHLKTIWKTYVESWGYLDRGDDLLISLSMSHYYKTNPKSIRTKIRQLYEGPYALSGRDDHSTKRWNLIQSFLTKYND